MRREPLNCVLLALLLLATWPSLAARPSFALEYRVAFKPETGEASVVIATAPADGRLLRMTIPLDPKRYSAVEGDGTLARDGRKFTWSPPRKGGTLRDRRSRLSIAWLSNPRPAKRWW